MTGNYRVTGMPGIAAACSERAVSRSSCRSRRRRPTPRSSTTHARRRRRSWRRRADKRCRRRARTGSSRSARERGRRARVGRREGHSDFSGSLVQSDKPVQVIASVPCINIPQDKDACDHIEETVLPAETLGKHYVVAPPTGPKGKPVRTSSSASTATRTARRSATSRRSRRVPATRSTPGVVDCGVVDRRVRGDAAPTEFARDDVLLGAEVYEDRLRPEQKGDPSQSNVVSVEQFRTKYVFLAPNDYPVLWADITATEDAESSSTASRSPPQWTSIGEPVRDLPRRSDEERARTARIP